MKTKEMIIAAVAAAVAVPAYTIFSGYVTAKALDHLENRKKKEEEEPFGELSDIPVSVESYNEMVTSYNKEVTKINQAWGRNGIKVPRLKRALEKVDPKVLDAVFEEGDLEHAS